MLEMIWITREGRQIPVSRMTTSHIQNCIAKICRSGWRQEYLERLRLEIEIRCLENRL